MEYSNIEDILNEMELHGSLGLDGVWLLDHPMAPGYFRVDALSRPITYSYGGPPYFQDFDHFKRVQLLHHSYRMR